MPSFYLIPSITFYPKGIKTYLHTPTPPPTPKFLIKDKSISYAVKTTINSQEDKAISIRTVNTIIHTWSYFSTTFQIFRYFKWTKKINDMTQIWWSNGTQQSWKRCYKYQIKRPNDIEENTMINGSLKIHTDECYFINRKYFSKTSFRKSHARKIPSFKFSLLFIAYELDCMQQQSN